MFSLDDFYSTLLTNDYNGNHLKREINWQVYLKWNRSGFIFSFDPISIFFYVRFLMKMYLFNWVWFTLIFPATLLLLFSACFINVPSIVQLQNYANVKMYIIITTKASFL